MYHVNPFTLASAKQFIGLHPLDMSNVPVPRVVEALIEYESSIPPKEKEAHVELQAVKFYLTNHAFAELCSKYDDHEILSSEAKQLADFYCQSLAEIGRRLFSYTLMITTRESRHLGKGLKTTLKNKFGQEFVLFLESLPSSSGGAVNALKGEPPQMSIGRYAEALEYLFNNGNFSSGYGGKPWGEIAGAMRRYVQGTTSLEAFVDTAWTLAHNNGPMFNKGMLYAHYSSLLQKVLDVQASGQMPHYVNDILNGPYGGDGLDATELGFFWAAVSEALPEFKDIYVDWWEVEKNSVFGHNYSAEKKIQVETYGPPPEMAAAMKAQEEEMKSRYYVSPGAYVKKVSRKKAA